MLDESINKTKEAKLHEEEAKAIMKTDGVPARLLKGCAQAIAIPLELMWRRYLDEGVVPSYYKLSLVTPLNKKRDRVLSGNYRPMSLNIAYSKGLRACFEKEIG